MLITAVGVTVLPTRLRAEKDATVLPLRTTLSRSAVGFPLPSRSSASSRLSASSPPVTAGPSLTDVTLVLSPFDVIVKPPAQASPAFLKEAVSSSAPFPSYECRPTMDTVTPSAFSIAFICSSTLAPGFGFSDLAETTARALPVGLPIFCAACTWVSTLHSGLSVSTGASADWSTPELPVGSSLWSGSSAWVTRRPFSSASVLPLAGAAGAADSVSFFVPLFAPSLVSSPPTRRRWPAAPATRQKR